MRLLALLSFLFFVWMLCLLALITMENGWLFAQDEMDTVSMKLKKLDLFALCDVFCRYTLFPRRCI